MLFLQCDNCQINRENVDLMILNLSENIEKTIDIDKILKSKMGDKARFVPRFMVNWLKHIIHEDEVNRFLGEHLDEKGTEWLNGYKTGCLQ